MRPATCNLQPIIRSGGVLAVMLAHLLNNIVSGAFVGKWFTGADWVSLGWLSAGLWCLLALGLLLLVGMSLGRKPTDQTAAIGVGQPLAAK